MRLTWSGRLQTEHLLEVGKVLGQLRLGARASMFRPELAAFIEFAIFRRMVADGGSSFLLDSLELIVLWFWSGRIDGSSGGG